MKKEFIVNPSVDKLICCGYHIIPVRPDTKQPYVRWKQYQTDTPRHETVERWFDMWPEAWTGIITGQSSGLFVLDIDNHDLVTRLVNKFGPHEGPICMTPRGEHWYYSYPPGDDVWGNATHLANVALDTRGEGGYVIAPTMNNSYYRWIVDPQAVNTYPIPDWLRNLYQNRREIDFTSYVED